VPPATADGRQGRLRRRGWRRELTLREHGASATFTLVANDFGMRVRTGAGAAQPSSVTRGYCDVIVTPFSDRAR